MVKAVLFDLDDTLYLEWEFIRGGFLAVAAELEKRGVGSAHKIYELFEMIHFNEGREYVFDKAASRLGFPNAWIPQLVEIYRMHNPTIEVLPDVLLAFPHLRERYLLGCVTDGIAAVQKRKLFALGLSPLFDSIIVTDLLGRKHWKPDPLPFMVCCHELGITSDEAIYVGDNPQRDIVGAHNANMIAARIKRPQTWFYDYEPQCSEEEPDFVAKDLTELIHLLRNLGSKVYNLW